MAFALLSSLVLPGSPVRIQPTLRVDLVGLPDLTKSEMQAITPPPPAAEEKKEIQPKPPQPVEEKRASAKKPVEEPARPDEMVLKRKQEAEEQKQREKNIKDSLARMKSLAKIQEFKDSANAPQSAPLIKGNKISKGTSLSGDARESDNSTYYDQLRDHLASQWSLPVWLSRQNLSAQVQIRVTSSGRLGGYKLTKSSGNAQFDEAVIRALQDSQPYPRPPSDLARELEVRGVLVGFPL